MKNFKIGKIDVGNDSSVLVIPEIGINHGGSLKIAMTMADSAKRAGARIIKHQTHVVEDEMCAAAKSVIPGNADVSIYEIMENCALDESDEFELFKYVKSLGMEFLSTPFSRAAADRLEKFGVLAYKIGSGEMNNIPLIKHIAAFGKPMIISTGMNGIESIKETVEIVKSYNVPCALLHTTNLYPTPPNLVRLNALGELKKNFPEVLIGISDHTLNNNACIGAMALGAKIAERHYTDHKKRSGPDIACSMDEQELHELLTAAQEIPLMLTAKKAPLKEEDVTIKFAFASVVSIRRIKKGEVFTRDNIWVKRPGTGNFKARDFETLLGKRAACDIGADALLTRRMVCDE